MGAPFLLPNISDVNSAATTNATNTDTTLNSTDDGSVSAGQVLDDLISIAPSLLLLSKTPQNKLPTVTGGTAANPVLTPTATNLTSSNLTLIILIIAVMVAVIMIFKK